jgi:hypothetical protein
MILF